MTAQTGFMPARTATRRALSRWPFAFKSAAWRSSVQKRKRRRFAAVTARQFSAALRVAEPSRRWTYMPLETFSSASSAQAHSWSVVMPAAM